VHKRNFPSGNLRAIRRGRCDGSVARVSGSGWRINEIRSRIDVYRYAQSTPDARGQQVADGGRFVESCDMERAAANKPEYEQSKRDLNELREKLVVLHKALIDSERVEYESSFGAIATPNQFLKLLINDPWFAWLQPFSAMVVGIDELIDEKEALITKADVARVKEQAANLLKASEEGEGFGRSYFESLQREPEVVLAHAAVMKLLK